MAVPRMSYEQLAEFLEEKYGCYFQGLYYQAPSQDLEKSLVMVSDDRSTYYMFDVEETFGRLNLYLDHLGMNHLEYLSQAITYDMDDLVSKKISPPKKMYCNDFSVDEMVDWAEIKFETKGVKARNSTTEGVEARNSTTYDFEARTCNTSQIGSQRNNVSGTDSGTDSEPLEQVQNDAGYNVFANDLQHSEQSESVINTCLVETDDRNAVPDSPDIKSLRESISVRDSCLVVLQTKQAEFEKYKAFNDFTVDYDKLKRKLNETLGQLALKDIEIKEGLKTKAYEISLVKEKHNELMKQSLLTKSHYEKDKASNASSGERDCSRIVSDKENDQGLENQSNTSRDESNMSRNECNDKSTFGDDTDIKPSYNTKAIVEVPYTDEYNVFAVDTQHYEQPECIINTCVVEKVDSNVIPDSPDICDNEIQTDQNAVECDDERASQEYYEQLAHANEVRKKMRKKSFMKFKPNIFINIGFLPVSKSISKSRQAYNVMTNNVNHFRELVDQAWEKHSHNHFCALTALDMEVLIKTCLMPLVIKTRNDSFTFVHELKQEMHADLKYVESLKNEIGELEYDKADFSNMYDILLQECVSSDMCSYLHSLSDLDAHPELQCLYLYKVKECKCLAQKLSKQIESVSKEVYTELLRSFAKLEKHSISLELALQQYQEQMKNDIVSKEKASNIASQAGVSHDLKKQVTPHYWPQVRKSSFAKPYDVNAPGPSRKSPKHVSFQSPRESVGSDDLVHNYYLEEAKKKAQL
nr:peroxidase 20 [Tanacetum cinerariifolium]